MKPSHIIVLVVVLVVVFGASKLPDVAKYFGQSLKVLRKEMREFHDEDSASAAKPSGSSAHEGRAPASEQKLPEGNGPSSDDGRA